MSRSPANPSPSPIEPKKCNEIDKVELAKRTPPRMYEILERMFNSPGRFVMRISILCACVYAKYSTAFLNNFIPSPSLGRGFPFRLSSSFMRVQFG